MPAVNRDLMYQAMLRETKAKDNQMLYWSRLLDWKNQTLTPDTDANPASLTPDFDMTDVGPVVMEDTAGRRRRHRWHDHGCLADAVMYVGRAVADKGKGGD